jgi:PAS domain S-box-containing protein
LARFATSTTAEVESHIETSLREIAEFVGVDYALIVRTAPDLSSWSVAYEWCSPSAPSRMADFQQVPMGSWGFNENVLLSGKVLRLNRMDDVPPEAADVRKQMEFLGFKSTLQVPTRRPGGQVSGCIALVSLDHEVTWVETDIQRLRVVGDAIANAIERARVEKELRESEARYRSTFQQAPVGILNVTRGGEILRANQKFWDILGYSHEEVRGRHYCDFTHPDDIPATKALYDNLLANRGAAASLEKRYLRKDGRVVWGNLTLSQLFSNDVEPNVFIAVIEDITARKQAEETIDAVPDLIYVVDCHHRIVRANLGQQSAWAFPVTRC